jgi:hypothetical protein
VSLFRCENCDHIENTALCNYAFRFKNKDKIALCSLCDPTIGKWHNVFPRRLYDPEKDIVKNPK